MARTCKEPVLLKHPLLGRYDSSPRKASLWRKVLHLLGEMELDVYSCKAGITACASVVGFRFFFGGGVLGLQFPFWAVPQAALVLRHFDRAKNPVCSETWNVGKGLTAFEGVLIFRFRVKFSR